MKRTFQENVSNYHRYSLLKCNTHYDMAELYKRRHRTFGIFVVIITSIVGTSVFAALAGLQILILQVFTGFLTMAAAVLAALQTFLGFSDLQSQHKTAAAGYSRVRSDLELLVMKFSEATGTSGEPGTAELESIKKHLDDLDLASPTIPNEFWEAVVKKTPET